VRRGALQDPRLPGAALDEDIHLLVVAPAHADDARQGIVRVTAADVHVAAARPQSGQVAPIAL
jgi:hypothetical protein